MRSAIKAEPLKIALAVLAAGYITYLTTLIIQIINLCKQ